MYVASTCFFIRKNYSNLGIKPLLPYNKPNPIPSLTTTKPLSPSVSFSASAFVFDEEMRERMERLVLLPFTVGCISESSVAVAVQQPRRPKSDTNPSPIRTKTVEQEEEEEEDNESLSGESTKNSFKSTALPKPNISTGIHRLFKGFKNFSQMFVEKEEMNMEMEMEMEIGTPTDVKHVTHIGWDGSSTNDPMQGWGNLISPDLLSVQPVNPWTKFNLSPSPHSDSPLVHGSAS